MKKTYYYITKINVILLLLSIILIIVMVISINTLTTIQGAHYFSGF